MAIFNLDIIKKSYFKENVFQDGETIYNTETITFNNMQKNMITDIYQINADVKENGNLYKVELGFKDKGESAILIGDRHCTCSFYTKSHENCRHMAALICNMNNYTCEELCNNDRDVIYTSEVINEIQEIYINAQYKKYIKRHSYTLIPYMTVQNEQVLTTFKIGLENSKQYILKDLEEFIHSVDNSIEVEYGKNFVCNHKLSDFDLKSQQLILFIKSKMAQIKLSPDKKNIIFSEFDMFLFFKHFVGHDLSIKYNEIEPRIYRCITGEMPFEIKLKDDEEMALLILTQTYPYVSFIDNSLCCIKGDTFLYHSVSDVKLMEFLKKTYKKVLKIKKEDLFVFYDNVLLDINKYINIDTNIDIDELYKDIPKTLGYIDLDDKKNVTVELKVKKDDVEINYFDLENKNSNIKASTEIQVTNLLEYYGDVKDGKFIISDTYKIYDFNKEGIKEFNDLIDKVKVSASYTKIHKKDERIINVGISVKNNLLEIDFSLDGIKREELISVLNAYNQKEKFYRLSNGSFIELDNKVLEELDNLIDGLNISPNDIANGTVNVGKFNALFLDYITKNSSSFDVRRDDQFGELLDTINQITTKQYPVPENLNASLREYQKHGYRYITNMKENGFGVILADDMGLGKTIQVITFLLNDLEHNKGKTLITCPSSLILNWEKEIKEFAPSIKVLTINMDGTKRKEQFKQIKDYDVIVTSYDLLKRDLAEYENLEFENFVIDESQYIKNSSTKNYQSVMKIKSKTNIALTGTPIENKLSELWSIMNFVVNGYLGTYKKFNDRFEAPIMRGDNEKILILKKLCAPFILRRLKKDVLLELPEKSEIFHYVQMNDEQEKLYRANIIEMKSEVEKLDIKTSKLKVLSMLMKLRQIACDPSLVYDDYTAGSAKLDTTIELIKMSIEAGHKVLLFSQFTSMLNIIKDKLEEDDISHYILTGSTKKQDRYDLSESFNKDDTSVFLISLKAGGTGLNLVGADIVIHFDPWWNMSAQNQATDRVYRIGQENNVTVYKIIADHTIEGKIVEMQEKKGRLAESILDGTEAIFGTITEDELLHLFD